MKQSTSFAHWASKCASICTFNKNRYYLFLINLLLTLGAANAWGAYEKASSIAVGDVVVLVYETDKKELEGISTTSTKYGIGVSYTTTPDGAYELTVEAGSTSGTYSFKCPNGQYLYWSTGNSLATNATKSANTSWKVTFSNGNAAILNAKDNTRKLQWNASSPRFACYTTSQKAVQLYKKSASYTVNWTINPAAGGSLSPTSGTSTTVTPNVAYTYGSPAYTVTPAGKANVSQYGDNFTATPSANCTIQINMVAKPTYTVNWYVNGTKEHSQTGVAGTTLTEIPNLEDYECGDKVFVGWTTQSSYEHATNAPTGMITSTTGMTIPENDVNYYAVFAEGEGTETTTSISGGDWSDGVAGGNWITSGTGIYSGNGVKFDGANDYVLSPDISSKNYSELLLKFKSGYNGSKGSVLTFYAYNKDQILLTDDDVTISPKTVVPDVSYTSQNTIYEVSISANEVIGKIMIKMTSKTSNLGMKYCEIFGVSSFFQNYTTECSTPSVTYTVTYALNGGAGTTPK
jgi:hypothetical protein